MQDEGHDHAGCFSHPSTSELEALETTAQADSPKRDTPPPLHEITPVAMGSCASGNSPHHAPPRAPKKASRAAFLTSTAKARSECFYS